MKHTLLIITALMLVVGCSSDKEESSSQMREPIDDDTIKLDINNLIDRGGLKYAPNDDEPYTGKVFVFYENGQKMFDGRYRKGLMNGKWTYYHENGQKRTEANYKDGEEIERIV